MHIDNINDGDSIFIKLKYNISQDFKSLSTVIYNLPQNIVHTAMNQLADELNILDGSHSAYWALYRHDYITALRCLTTPWPWQPRAEEEIYQLLEKYLIHYLYIHEQKINIIN